MLGSQPQAKQGCSLHLSSLEKGCQSGEAGRGEGDDGGLLLVCLPSSDTHEHERILLSLAFLVCLWLGARLCSQGWDMLVGGELC